MKKRTIITTSILVGLLALCVILFGAVFRLRNQTVEFVGERTELTSEITKKQIKTASGLKNGKSIFMLDKAKSINKIEDKFAYIKVIQIKTTSVVGVKIRVRERTPMFYTTFGGNYYILDEELKVLDIIRTDVEGLTAKEKFDALTYTPIQLSEKVSTINLNQNTEICDFLWDNKHQDIVYSMVRAMLNVVDIENDELQLEPITRSGIKQLVRKIEFDVGYTKDGSYTRLILTLKTGLKIDIAKPETNIQNKINTCFSAYYQLKSPDPNKPEEQPKITPENEKFCTIKYYYDANGKAKCRLQIAETAE